MVSALHLVPIADSPLYEGFGDLGVTFLLFLVGLEINVSSLKRVGAASVILGLGQIVVTFVGGFFIGVLLGFSPLAAAYVAIALTFSSTVIVVKLLSERQDINSLYGKLSLGILLVQDIVAILLLVILAGVQSGNGLSAATLIWTIGEALLMFTFAYWLGRTILPSVFQRIARSEEALFITSLAWVLLIAAVVQQLGFSIEIGGFLAGISLANSSTHFEIASRVRPLRDFFIALFFIVLGSTVVLSNLAGLTIPIIVFSLFVLIGNPLIVVSIMGIMGYHRRTSFMTGITVAQISEFSLVLAALGLQLGHITSQEVSLITGVGVVTIALSSYLVLYGEKLYTVLHPVIALFHRGSMPPEPIDRSPYDRPILLIGAHRIGRSIAHHLPQRSLTILDFDPDVVVALEKQGFQTIFGDSTDLELLNELPFERIRLVIGTMPNLEDNLQLIAFLNEHRAKRRRRVILRADTDADAKILYDHGVDYVLQPQISSGQHLGRAIAADRTWKVLDDMRDHDQQLITRVHHG